MAKSKSRDAAVAQVNPEAISDSDLNDVSGGHHLNSITKDLPPEEWDAAHNAHLNANPPEGGQNGDIGRP